MSEAAVAERPRATSTPLSFRLVDADAHIGPPCEMWKEYLPAQLRELAPSIEEGDECDYVVFEGSRKPLRMIGNQAGRAGKDFKMVGKVSHMRDPLTQKPSFYMDQDVYASFIQDRTGVLTLDLPGGRNITWSSDYPHSEKDIREICSTRAAKLYGVK